MSNNTPLTSETRVTEYSSATCACCGMVTSGPKEFHPYAACLMFQACHDGHVVRANLQFVVDYGRQLAGVNHEAQHTADERVYVSFPLLTGGEDAELDAISIVVESMKQLEGEQIGRILTYLQARYTRQRS